jgi:Ca-activated chloride channel family protein
MGYVRQKSVDRMLNDTVLLTRSNPAEALKKLNLAVTTTQRLGNREMESILQRARMQLEQTGQLDADTAKVLKVTTRNKTVRLSPNGSGLSEADVRRVTGA